MKKSLFLILITYLLVVNAQQRCTGRYNESIIGQCSSIDDCQGTTLDAITCENRRCCVPKTQLPSITGCLNPLDFYALYNTSRATYLQSILNYGMNQAGICSNCRAKAAFLAIAATMTENFQKDEAIGSDAFFSADDQKYGNSQSGDGSRFRRRGFFGLRGRRMYERLQSVMSTYQSFSNPESAAIVENAIQIAVELWKKPDLINGPELTQHADGTFYGLSILWYRLAGGIEELPEAAKQYSKFLRQLQCGGDLYPGQGGSCQFNATHTGFCSPDCIRGLEDAGEFCGCSGAKGPQCPNSPPHIRCCLDACTQELKMDLGLVLDASGSILPADYQLQLNFTKDLLGRVNVGRNKTHVGIINYSSNYQILTWLNTDYELTEKLQKVNNATHFRGGTNTAQALRQAKDVFSPAKGLRPSQEGATQVIFVITDGASDNSQATINAADVLKTNGIHLVSVGVGNNLNLNELRAICTPPSNENYFPIADYAALDQTINQFTSKTCTEPAVIPTNTTVTGEVGKEKYKFLKLEIVAIGNKIMISVQLFNGKIKLFHSFTTRNPKDPDDFTNYQSRSDGFSRSLWPNFISKSKNVKAAGEIVNLIVDRPNEKVDFVYVGIKGVEEENKFEVKLDDCELVECRSGASSLTMKFSMIFLFVCFVLSMKTISYNSFS